MKNDKTESSRFEEDFSRQISTEIWQEVPDKSNPFVAETAVCRGYDFLELVQHLSYPQMLYLFTVGELPSDNQRDVLELLMKALITPGVRHPATRAVMNAAISKTRVPNLLPIGLGVLTGEYLGAHELSNSMKFIQHNLDRPPKSVAIQVSQVKPKPDTPNPIPGFGSIYGDQDKLTAHLAAQILSCAENAPHLKWCQAMVDAVPHSDFSWLPAGLAAATFLDLNIDRATGIGLFQMLQSPGLIAHAAEKVQKPVSDMPFLDDEHYDIKR